MRLPAISRLRPAIELHRAVAEGPGRFDDGAFLIADPYMSSRHARIARKDGEDALEDLGSKHGTFVNGERLREPRPLRDGDLIEVGRSLLCYRLVDVRLAGREGGRGVEMGPTRTFCPELAATVLDLNRVAPTDQPILVLAEMGAGKEIAARHIHEKSGRAGLFVAIDCGAIPAHLVESELFGHKKGAFSGAAEERKGRIRSAEGGTVFLDEIGNMPEQAQASLLRVIQEREVTPGSTAAPETPAGSGRRKRPERDQIVDALERSGGVQGQAARLLGVHERQLARWMDALGIPRARGSK